MSDLFWPGEHRAGHHFTEQSFLDTLVRVESVWAQVELPAVDCADDWADDWADDRTDDRAEVSAEAGGNPVIELVRLLRERTGDPSLHLGLTSQDVIDSALMVMSAAAATEVAGQLRAQVTVLAALAEAHRDTPMVGRTLTQHAVPTTFGLKVATWLTGVLDAHDDVDRLSFPVQLGGAAGTLAALVALGLDVEGERTRLASGLGLLPSVPWHTTRRPVTRIADALVACTDAWARIANDVLTLSRPEIGELAEGTGGGSSTMPQKANPVLSVLIRRAALTTPQLAATLHLAAADQSDERAAGGWHAEWSTLQILTRRVLVAASQTTDLLRGLRVHPEAMADTLAAARDQVRAEQRATASFARSRHRPTPDPEPEPETEPEGPYDGAAPELVDAVLARARAVIG